MRVVKRKGRIAYVPVTPKECEYLLCVNCSLFDTSDCLVCKSSRDEIEKLKKEITKLKRQIKNLKEAQ